jgi:hypothetical protein
MTKSIGIDNDDDDDVDNDDVFVLNRRDADLLNAKVESLEGPLERNNASATTTS